MENNPRVIFERLFGDTGSTDPAVRRARLRKDASLLDSVTERAGDLARQIGPGDRAKLGQYLDAVRDVERRIQMAESQSDRELPVVDQPAGVPGTLGEHARLMFDLQALAFETDLTRVTTFMMGREITGRTYAEIGVPDAHHPISHHQRDPAKLAKLTKINQYHVQLFSQFLERLGSTPDGDGTLLDHSMIVYGAGMADSNSHASQNLPILLAGGGAGTGPGTRADATSSTRRTRRWPTCTSPCSTSWACRSSRSATPPGSCGSIRWPRCRPGVRRSFHACRGQCPTRGIRRRDQGRCPSMRGTGPLLLGPGEPVHAGCAACELPPCEMRGASGRPSPSLPAPGGARARPIAPGKTGAE